MRNHPGSQYNHIHFSQYSSQTIWHNYGRFRGMERGNKGEFARGLHFAHSLHLLASLMSEIGRGLNIDHRSEDGKRSAAKAASSVWMRGKAQALPIYR